MQLFSFNPSLTSDFGLLFLCFDDINTIKNDHITIFLIVYFFLVKLYKSRIFRV